MDPSQIRQSVRQKRRQMSDSVRLTASQQICKTFMDRADFRAATNIGAFLAFDGEPDLATLISTAWDRGQRVFLPIVQGKEQPMSFAAYDKESTLVKNRFGILEPDPATALRIDPPELDCVLAPLVAFDAECHRIGVGGGFYDRTFAFKRTAAENQTREKNRPTMIGVAFEFQKVESIQPQPWDVPLDAVVTEKQTYNYGKRN